MRPVHLAKIDKVRPVVLLTRESVRSRRNLITVAPITSQVRGLSVEVPVGPPNGIERNSVINCDAIQTIKVSDVGRFVGVLTDHQERALAHAIRDAFDLEDP